MIETLMLLSLKPVAFAIYLCAKRCLRSSRNGQTPALPPTKRIQPSTPGAIPQPANIGRKDDRQEQESKVVGFETQVAKQRQGACEARHGGTILGCDVSHPLPR